MDPPETVPERCAKINIRQVDGSRAHAAIRRNPTPGHSKGSNRLPDLKALEPDPRYRALLRKLKLPE